MKYNLEKEYSRETYSTYGNIRVYDKLFDNTTAVIMKNDYSLSLIKPSKLCNILRKKGFKFDNYDKQFNYDLNEQESIPKWYIPSNYFENMNNKYIELYDKSYEFGFSNFWDIIFSK